MVICQPFLLPYYTHKMKKLLLIIACLFTISFTVNAQQNITGNVKNAQGLPIVKATINVLDFNLTSTTDNKGNFEIKNAPQGSITISVSAIGYATVIQSTAGNTSLDVVLEDAKVKLDEVIISAQKRDENLLNVPISITAFSANKVNDYRIQNTRDLSGLIPNFYSSNPGDGRNVTSIRGIATTSYDPAIATYIDGVNQFSLDTYISSLFDVERIEVLRGPQGTLYGRNAMGGVLNIITKAPTNYASGFATVDVGNYGQQRFSAGIKAPIIKDKLFFGAAGLVGRQGGFYLNEFNNTKFDEIKSFQGNYYLKLQASAKFALTLNVKHNENRNNGTFPLVASVEDALANPFKLSQNSTTQMVDNLFNASLSAKYSGNAVNFVSQTAYQSNYRFYKTPIDGDFSPLDGVSIVNNYGKDWNKVKVYTQEFKLSSNTAPNSKIKWLAGLYGFYQDNPVKQGTHFGADGELLGAPFPNFTSVATNSGESYGASAFGQISYAISSKLEMTLGLRYDYEHKKMSALGEFVMEGMEPVVTQNDTSSTASFNAFSPKLTMAYKIATNNNIFASYNRGYRAGGITSLGSDPSVLPLVSFKPEYSNNFEIGTKNSFLNNRLNINLTAFYTKLMDAQVPTLVLPDAVTITRNVGELTSKGLEFELAVIPFKGFNIDYNFGYTDAKYDELQVPKDGAVVNLAGNKQIYTPKITSALALQHTALIDKLSGLNLVVRGEWNYIGDQFYDLSNKVEQKGYGLINAKIGFTHRKFDLFAWGRNLSDKRYVDYAYDFGAAHLGNPKTYGLTLTSRF